MRIGIGLPAAIPDAAAAARSERVELMTTVLNVPFRRNAVLLGKQLASLERLSGGRLTVGMGLGGWPRDREASELPRRRLGAVMDGMLSTMRQVWDGDVSGASGPMPALPPGRPGLLFGGFAPASFERMAAVGQGWVAQSFGFEPLVDGIAAAQAAWSAAGRSGQPRIVVARYFSLGERADQTAGSLPGALLRSAVFQRCAGRHPHDSSTARGGISPPLRRRLRRRGAASLLRRAGPAGAARRRAGQPGYPRRGERCAARAYWTRCQIDLARAIGSCRRLTPWCPTSHVCGSTGSATVTWRMTSPSCPMDASTSSFSAGTSSWPARRPAR